MKWQNLGDEQCSLARTLSVIGDRWTLLVLREAFLRERLAPYKIPRRIEVRDALPRNAMGKVQKAELLALFPN